MKKIKVIIVILIVVGLVVAGIGKYFIDKKTVGLEHSKVDFTISCDSIFNEFTTDKTKATQKYLGKTVLLNGIVSSVEKDGNNVSVMYRTLGGQGNVVCRMDSLDAPKLKAAEGQNLRLKGECTGYEDDLLVELSFNRCVLINE
jgi:hypothetical protein